MKMILHTHKERASRAWMGTKVNWVVKVNLLRNSLQRFGRFKKGSSRDLKNLAPANQNKALASRFQVLLRVVSRRPPSEPQHNEFIATPCRAQLQRLVLLSLLLPATVFDKTACVQVTHPPSLLPSLHQPPPLTFHHDGGIIHQIVSG